MMIKKSPTSKKELLELFNAFKVEYMIVGGYALAFYGAPRYTGDIDILVNPTPPNSQKIMAALETFGFGSVGLYVLIFSAKIRNLAEQV